MLKVDCQVDRQRREQELASCFRAARRCAAGSLQDGMGVKVWGWRCGYGYWCCGGIVVPSSIEWVFKACARHRQIFTPVTPQLYNISRIRMPFIRVASTHTIRIRFCDHGRATLLIVVHNSICQVPPTLFKHQDPDGKPDCPRSRSGPLGSSTRTRTGSQVCVMPVSGKLRTGG